MAMSKSSYTYNRKTWEDSEFPILCQTCLGDNPYLRMMKEKFGRECKICVRPFTTFRWCPGRGMRYKKTEVCQTCAKLKNVCQTCLLDLEYGLPVQVRDYALQLQDEMPKTGANRDFYIQNQEREVDFRACISEGAVLDILNAKMAQTDGTTPGGALSKIADQGPNELLMKLARTQPYYDRNRPHICSFWVKGECKRGEECPYRHDKPSDPDDPLSDQNMKDRYYGQSDPVAEKLLNRAKAMPVLKPPEDKGITTLYIGNLGEDGYIEDKDLRNYFYQFGEIRSISLLSGKGCGFVQFTTRTAAENAAEKTFNKLTLKNRRITIRWGKPQSQQNLNNALGEGSKPMPPVPGLPGALPPPPVDFFNLSGSASGFGGPGGGGADDDGAGPSKRRRAEIPPPPNLGIPPPMRPPPGGNPRAYHGMGVPPPPPPGGMIPLPPDGALPKIHYPSQDPQHLGAKDLCD